SGEGADEILAGYERFIIQDNPFYNKYFIAKLKQNSDQFFPYIKYYLNPDYRMILLSSFGSFSTAIKLKKDFSFKQAIIQRKDILEKISKTDKARHRKYEVKTYLPDLLMRQDKMSMANSIENRVPFLDNEIVEF